MQFHGLLVVYFGGSGGDKSIINGVGGPVTSTDNPGIGTPVLLTGYPSPDPDIVDSHPEIRG